MYERIQSWENLLHAYQRAAKGKRGRGEVAAFEYRLEENLLGLQKELAAETYRPGPYRSFVIRESKRRLISAAPFRDRVVHHALCNLIEPVFERGFVADSFANRIGKGTHRALDRAQAYARRFPYVLQLDVQQFFPSIDHAILGARLASKITDGAVLRLIDLILASGDGVLSSEYRMRYFEGDDLLAANRPRGLPIGNLTSQFWANVFLDPLDHFIKRDLRCPGYVRYVDDLLLFSDDKRQLRSWLDGLEEKLARLRLTHHPGAHPRPVAEGIPFLGFVIYRGRRRVKGRKLIAYRRHLRGLIEGWESCPFDARVLEDSLRGWENHLRYADTGALRRQLRSGLIVPGSGA